MLGDISVQRKVVTSDAVTQIDAFQWTVVFLSKVRTILGIMDVLSIRRTQRQGRERGSGNSKQRFPSREKGECGARHCLAFLFAMKRKRPNVQRLSLVLLAVGRFEHPVRGCF